MPGSSGLEQIVSPPDWFEKSYNSIAQSNNLLLVTNGVILGAFITLMSEVIAPEDLSAFNYSLFNNNGQFVIDVPLIPFRLMLIALGIVFPILISIGCSLGSNNSGLYPRHIRGEPNDQIEFIDREREALKWYSYASMSLVVAVISTFAVFTSFIFGLYSFWILVVCQAMFSYLVIVHNVFRGYGDLSNNTAGSPVNNRVAETGVSGCPSPEGSVIHLYHHLEPLTTQSCGEDTEESNEA